MFQVISSAWALLLGMFMLMLGNGMQMTLVGVRGQIEGFSTLQISIIMSAYFLGFLGGSRMAPGMIRRVGHVRVFAALASMISAVIILYPAVTEAWVWVLGRVLIGFCFSAVYVTAESWLNDAAENNTRGQALSLYMVVQTSGIVAAQGLVLLADPSGFILFVIPSILVSIAVTPVLLSISPVPAFDTTKPMNLRELLSVSPLGCIGMLLLGGIFSAQFGMAAVYAGQVGLNLAQVSLFAAMFFIGAIILQYPIGWISDRVDRRLLIVCVSLIGTVSSICGILIGSSFVYLLASAFVLGGMANPLYSLLIAHTNDFLDHDDMAAASGGLVFISGLGAIAGPLTVGAMMDAIGPPGFFVFTGMLFVAIVIYASWRATQRATIPIDETGSFVAMSLATTTPVAMEIAQEYVIDSELAEAEAEAEYNDKDEQSAT